MYVQAESPGTDNESNWLPVPKDAPFAPNMRLYSPRPQVADGTWAPPPLAPDTRASASAAVLRATRRFAASLASDALPAGPTWIVLFPMAAKTGRHASTSAGSPPAKIVQSPRSTIALVPLIGASRNPIPAAAAPSARRRVWVGEIVLIWINVVVRGTISRSPPAPRTATSTESGEGRIVKTASAPSAASRRFAAALSPRGPSPAS